MSIEDKMTIDERREYLKKMQERYRQADRKEGTASPSPSCDPNGKNPWKGGDMPGNIMN